MNPTHLEREIFDKALDIASPEERLGYLKGACGEDAALLDRVRALIRAQEQAEGFLLEQPERNATERIATVTEKAGDRIGRYKLLQKVGEGGCGVVYMAEQEEPVRRRVALKVIKLGMDTKSVIARFEAERQALAMMDHPNIARVLDAGATEAGRPFFVMELVRGIKITEYCDQNNLSTGERLNLFLQICRAIQHAHQKGIIHRDIKPSNILVTVNDGVPIPKVIDFGIAKATTEHRLTDKTLFTAYEQFLGTPAYMSPEQADMTSLDIDTRSDIYSLGVLLYELLTGRTPFDAKELVKAGLDEMRRTIREKEPERPSTRLSTMLAVDLTSAAKHRQTESPKLISLVRGDLDWIVMKALEKDRTRRYETANGLASDIQRHLNNEPVVARPPSKVYRFRKMVRRNKLAFAAVAAIAATLLVSAVVSSWQALRATRAERHAHEEALHAQQAEKQAKSAAETSIAVSEFLQKDLLAQASPESEPDRDLKLRTVLDRAAQKIEGRFTKQPLVEAAIRTTIVKTYSSLGEFSAAEPHGRRAVELYRSELGNKHSDTLMSMNNLAQAYLFGGRLAQTETLLAQAVDTAKSALGPEHPITLELMETQAHLYRRQDKLIDATAQQAHVLDIRKRVLGLEHSDTLKTMNSLAYSYRNRGHLAEAVGLQAQAVDIHKRVRGPEHPETLHLMIHLAGLYQNQGKLAEAETLHAQVVDTSKRALGPEHPDTLRWMNYLAATYRVQGKLADSEKLYAQVREIGKRVAGPNSLAVLGSMNGLASTYRAQGKPADAENLLKEALQVHRLQTSPNPQAVADTLASLGDALLAQNKPAEAESLLRECLDLRKKSALDDWRLFNAQTLLGGALMGLNRLEAAEPLLLGGYEGLKQRQQSVPLEFRALRVREAAERLVQLYDAWDKSAQAAEWRQKLKALDEANAETKSAHASASQAK